MGEGGEGGFFEADAVEERERGRCCRCCGSSRGFGFLGLLLLEGDVALEGVQGGLLAGEERVGGALGWGGFDGCLGEGADEDGGGQVAAGEPEGAQVGFKVHVELGLAQRAALGGGVELHADLVAAIVAKEEGRRRRGAGLSGDGGPGEHAEAALNVVQRDVALAPGARHA